MRHVFIVHSNITFLIAKLIIEFERINLSDVILILHRNFSVPEEIGCEVLELDEFIPTKNFISNYFLYKKLETNIIQKINSKFKLYVPHLMDTRFLYLISHEQCYKFSFIEEGSINYKNDINLYKSNRVGFLRKMLYRIKYIPKGLAEYVSKSSWFILEDQKLDKSYVFSNDSLYPITNKHVFQLETSSKSLGQYDCIIVFDALSIYNIISFEEMMDLLTMQIIPHVKERGYFNAAFKLHPEHWTKKGEIEASEIRRYFNSIDIKIIELPKNFEVETYMSLFDCSIYTFVSSLSLYANLFNVPSYTVFDRVSKLNNKIDSSAYSYLKKSINI